MNDEIPKEQIWFESSFSRSDPLLSSSAEETSSSNKSRDDAFEISIFADSCQRTSGNQLPSFINTINKTTVLYTFNVTRMGKLITRF